MPVQTSRSNYYDGITSPVPNTAPIYPRVPIDARCRLTNQVCGLNPVADQIQPVFLFAASESGALIESFETMSLITPEINGGGTGGGSGGGTGGGSGGGTGGGSGGGTGGTFADGPVGLGDPNLAGTIVVLRFYTRRSGDDIFYLEYEYPLDQTSRRSWQVPQFPILPGGQSAWRLAPFEEVYVALNRPIRAPGINVFMRGGQYS